MIAIMMYGFPVGRVVDARQKIIKKFQGTDFEKEVVVNAQGFEGCVDGEGYTTILIQVFCAGEEMDEIEAILSEWSGRIQFIESAQATRQVIKF